jgi:spermidine synthase
VKPTVVLDRAKIPGGELTLSKRGDELSIRVRGVDLMSSRNHDSEDELGRLTAQLANGGRILVGGLGLGFTLRAVLDGCDSQIDVAELVPAVVEWNRTHAAALNGNAIADPRVTVIEGDVAIALDVDNGPDELFDSNKQLYTRKSLAATKRALAPGGGLAVWSSFDSNTFTAHLRSVGFAVEVKRIKARGARHVIWLARSQP